MKTVAKVLSLSILVLLASCKKDETPTVNKDDAVGTWNLTSVSCNDGTTSTTVTGFPTISGTFKVSSKNHNLTVTFDADGTYESQGSYTAVVATTVGGTTDTQEEDSGFFEGMGTWSISGNTMTVNDGTETSTATIDELTSSKMVLSVKVDVSQSDPSIGFSSSTKGTYRFTMTK